MKKLTLVLPTLALALSLTLSPQSFASFTDVPASHPNYEAINYVQSGGIVEGYPDGTYGADLKINRAEFTKIITEAVFTDEEINACNTSIFKDVPVNEWFTKYVCIAEKNNIIDGYPDGTFQPANDIKIVEAAKIIVNGFKYPVQEDAMTWYKPYILKLEELKALPTSLTGFEHLVKRGEMAEVIYRLRANVTNKPSTTYANLELVTVPNGATAQEVSQKAYYYANTIIDIAAEVGDIFQEHVNLAESASTEKDFENLEAGLPGIITKISELISEIESMPAFLGDTSFRDGYIDHLEALNQLLDNGYGELIELVKKEIVNGELSEAEQAEVETISNDMEKLAAEMEEKILDIRKTFADKYGLTITQKEENNSGQTIALNEIGSCDKVKTVDFVVDEENLVQYGSFSWTGKIVSAEEDDGTHVRLEVASDNSEAFNFYKERALKSNNEGMNRFVNDKLYFALGSLDVGKLVTSAQDIDDATKLLIEQKVDSGEMVTLNFAVKFVEGGAIGNYGVTAACYMNQA